MQWKHITLLLFFYGSSIYAKQMQNEPVKPLFAAKLTHHIVLPNGNQADSVIFAVYTNKADNNYHILKNYFADTTYYQYSVNVIHTTNQYRLRQAHFIYLPERNKNDFPKLYEIIRDGPFYITENYNYPDSLFLNIYSNPADGGIDFDLNMENIISSGFTISPSLINLAKNDIDIEKVFAAYEQKIDNLYNKVQEQSHILSSQSSVINYLTNQIDENKKVIERQTTNIRQKEAELTQLKKDLKIWNDSVAKLKGQIRESEKNLEGLATQIAGQNHKIRTLSTTIQAKENAINNLDSVIVDKKRELTEQIALNQQQSETISSQKTRLILVLALLLVSTVLGLVIYWLYRVKNKSNTELSMKNKSINEQKQQIEKQKTHIEEQNTKLKIHQDNLEKLVHERTRELEIAKEKAEEANKLKTSFLTNMSHEIRTPLNAILGFTNLLVQDNVNQEDREDFLKYVDNSAQTLMNILDDVLNISLIETDQITIQYNKVYINKLINELYQHYETEKVNQQKGHLQIIMHEPSDDLYINTDEHRLKQVLNNLINNALKYTEEGQVEFGCYAENSVLIFYVTDTGIGISEQHSKYIFEPFNKIEDDKTKLYRGIGLGLSLSKRLIQLLEGHISVTSEKGKGSTFRITLPYNQKKSLNLTSKKTDQ